MADYNYNSLKKKAADFISGTNATGPVPCFDLHTISYEDAYNIQLFLFELVKKEQLKSAIIILEHYPVITIGNNRKKENIISSESMLKKQDISLFQSNRGGDVTFHGPGQLVCYPIFNLTQFGKDLTLFVHKLEQIIIDVLEEFSIEGKRIEKLRGVFVDNEKIASIGLRVKKWITLHGFSLNINVDLDYYKNIIACGLKGHKQTSLEKILDRAVKVSYIKELVLKYFERNFQIKIEII